MPCVGKARRAPNSPMSMAAQRKFFDGAKVALFGGSFDPPHDGHRLVAKAALRALKVDYVWFLVSPQNPLKNHKPKALAQRLAAVRDLANERRFIVSDEELRLGTFYAIDTVRALKATYPQVIFPKERVIWPRVLRAGSKPSAGPITNSASPRPSSRQAAKLSAN